MAIDWEFQRQYKILLADCNLPAAIELVSDRLRALPAGPFHLALELGITNAPESVAAWLKACLAAADEVEPVRTAYVEINGFDFNTDLWFFDFYAYREELDPQDAGRIDSSHWCSEDPHAIEGLESLQRVYAEHRSDIRGDAAMYASLLVLFRFFALVKAATALLPPRDFPVIAGFLDDDDRLVIP